MATVNGMGAGQSDNWNTPKFIFDALDCVFDLDVAAPESGPIHVPAKAWFSEGSLNRTWDGFVWMNAPFGGRNGLSIWMDKFFKHGDGIALTPDRTSAPWFQDSWPKADVVRFARKTPFLLDDGSKAGSPAFGTTLWGVGNRAASALIKANSLGLLVFPKSAVPSTVALAGEYPNGSASLSPEVR